MTQRAVFECDGCGDRHGHRTEMFDFDVVYPSGEYEPPRRETLHVCVECGPEGISGILTGLEEVRVERSGDDGLDWSIIDVRTSTGERLTREVSDQLEGVATGDVAALGWIEDVVL